MRKQKKYNLFLSPIARIIIQSSFFKKAIGFFPIHVEKVLMKLNAVHYPEVISLMYSKNQEWGIKNCSYHL